MAARDEATAVRDRDWRPLAVAFDNGGNGGDLGGGMGVGIFRVRFQVRNPDKLIVGAVDGHADLAFMPNPERRRCARGIASGDG